MHAVLQGVWPSMNQYRMFFVHTSIQPPTPAPKPYQTWKQNNQLPTKSHDELKDNSIMGMPFVKQFWEELGLDL